MYDIEIVVPADTNKPHIAERLKDFKKYGLYNVQNTSVRLVFAVAKNNNHEQLLDGWDKSIDVAICETPYEQVAQRIYHYYADFIEPDTAKWYFRIDEDSLTDISATFKNLERDFDWQKEYHIGTAFNHDISQVDRKIAKTLGFEHLYEIRGPMHEVEMSMTTNVAMKAILNNPQSKKYFAMRKLFAEGYGDHGLAIAARMNKIYPVQIDWISPEANLCNFTIFGGFLTHVHHTSRKNQPQLFEFLDIFTSKETIETDCLNGEYLLKQKEENDKENAIWIKIENRNILDGNNNSKIGVLHLFENGKISLFLRDWGRYGRLIVFKDNKNLVDKNISMEKI